MTQNTSLLSLTVGAFALAALALPAAAAPAPAGVTDELSAQTFGGSNPQKKGAAPARKPAPRAIVPNRGPGNRAVGPGNRGPGNRTFGPGGPGNRVVTPGNRGPGNRTFGPGGPGNRVVGTPGRGPRVVTFRGPRTVFGGRLRGIPGRGPGAFAVRGQNYSAWRNGYRINRGGRWLTFAPLVALGAIAVGAATYYPYAYLTAPQPFCDGLTEDGCQMMWQDVPTVEGGSIGQCVAYCPWQDQ